MAPRVDIIIIATAKYRKFLHLLQPSILLYFLKDCDVRTIVLTDGIKAPMISYDYCLLPIEHEPWPYVTLHRFHNFQQIKYEIDEKPDYYFYIDADALIKDEITSEILGDRVFTQHCGYVGKRGPFERRPNSSAFVPHHKRTSPYYTGSFWGMSYTEFWRFTDTARKMVDQDKSNDIIPTWWDESIMNRYLIDNPPTKVLSPSYHYPENNTEAYIKQWPERYPCKILTLNKDHEEIRSEYLA